MQVFRAFLLSSPALTVKSSLISIIILEDQLALIYLELIEVNKCYSRITRPAVGCSHRADMLVVRSNLLHVVLVAVRIPGQRRLTYEQPLPDLS